MTGVLNTRGQATVEAILMLILGVAMVIGLMAGFSKSFSKFTELYFGTYFSCLIAEGELPRLKYVGGGDGCGEKFQSFSFSEGWAQNSKSSTLNSAANSKNKPSSNGSASSGRRSTRGVNEGGAFSNSHRFAISPNRKGGGATNSSSNTKKKEKNSSGYGGQKVGTYGKFSNGNDGSIQVIRIKRSSKSKRGSSYGLYKDPGDKKIKVKGALNKSSEIGSSGKNNTRLKIDRRVAKVQKKKDEGFKLNFSAIMRFLIIVALIIVIIIVIGGQLLSISKSFE